MHVADCELCSDALEGLAAIDQKERIPFWVREMKWELLRKMRKRNRHRRRSLAQPADYYIQLVLIVLAILFLLLAGFWAMYFFMK